MPMEWLDRLFAHMFWADRRIIDLLDASGAARAGEAMRLFSHVLAAERVWLLRLRGEDASIQEVWPELSLPGMKELADANAAAYTRFLRSLSPEDLGTRIEYANTRGTRFRSRIDDVLSHVALHGSYHRGQVAAALRRSGAEPVNTDFITYVRELDRSAGA